MTVEELWQREVNRKIMAHDRLLADFQRGLDALTEQVDDRALRSELSDLRSEVMEQVRTPFDQER